MTHSLSREHSRIHIVVTNRGGSGGVDMLCDDDDESWEHIDDDEPNDDKKKPEQEHGMSSFGAVGFDEAMTLVRKIAIEGTKENTAIGAHILEANAAQQALGQDLSAARTSLAASRARVSELEAALASSQTTLAEERARADALAVRANELDELCRVALARETAAALAVAFCGGSRGAQALLKPHRHGSAQPRGTNATRRARDKTQQPRAANHHSKQHAAARGI